MKGFDKSIRKTIDLLDSGQLKSEDLIRGYIENLENENLENIFIAIFKEEAIRKAKEIDEKRKRGLKLGKLAGIPIAITDDISTKDVITTAGSKMLKNYIAPFDASIVEDLIKEDAIILGKLKIEEFNLQRLSYDKETIEFLPLIIGAEINGHQVSIKASYGLISRYGLISATSSLGGIYISGKRIEDIALVLTAIAGYDEKDSTSVKIEKKEYGENLERGKVNFLLNIPRGLCNNEDERLNTSLDKLRQLGLQAKEIELENIKYSSIAYKILSSGEFASNTGKYDGISFGYRTNNFESMDELYKKSRSESFGIVSKKTIIFGNYVISPQGYDRYYKKSQQIRRIIKEEIDTILGERGFLAVVVRDSMDKESKANYKTLANITGYPVITIKCKNEKNKDVELLILSKPFKEEELLQLAYIIEGEILSRGDK